VRVCCFRMLFVALAGVFLAGGCSPHRTYWARGEWSVRWGHPCQQTTVPQGDEEARPAQDAEASCPPPSEVVCEGGKRACGRCRRCLGWAHGLAKKASEPEVVAAGYRHPNLHPVPTRPVFAPIESQPGSMEMVPSSPAYTPDRSPPKPIHMPTPPVPERLPRATPESEAKSDQVTTSAPRELDRGGTAESWVFRATGARALESGSASRQAGTAGWQLRRY